MKKIIRSLVNWAYDNGKSSEERWNIDVQRHLDWLKEMRKIEERHTDWIQECERNHNRHEELVSEVKKQTRVFEEALIIWQNRL